MIKDSKHIVNLGQGATSTPEVQPVAFKATEEKKEVSAPSRLPIDASKLVTRRWLLSLRDFAKSSSKGGGRTTSPAPKGCATGVVSPITLLLNVHYLVIMIGATIRRER